MKRAIWWNEDGEFFAAVRPRKVHLQLPTPVAALPFIEWNTKISVEVKWGNLAFNTNYKMYEHRPPVRMNSPQDFKYTFRNQYGAAISLADYTAVYVSVKRQNDVEDTMAAQFDDIAAGKVKFTGFSFVSEGLYHVQFVVVDAVGTPRWGDPAQVRAAKNTPDLAADELMVY